MSENYQSHSNFGEEIVVKMIELLEKIAPTDFVIKAASWVIGEIGSDYYKNSSEKLEELSKIVIKCLDYDYEKQSSKKWVIDALVKLSSVPDFKNHSDVKIILERFIKHGDIELAQRSMGSSYLTQSLSGWPSTTRP